MSKCCEYNAGMLRTVCQFQRATNTDDGAGGYRKTWDNIAGAATKCHFRALSGGERWMAQRVEATTRNRIVCRYFSDLKEADRVIIAGRTYNISFINNVELRNKWLEIDLDGGVGT